jgi:hypothetical protein
VVRDAFLVEPIGSHEARLAVNAISQFRHFAVLLDAPRTTHHVHTQHAGL